MEEKWLQEQASKGWLLEHFCFIRYRFTACKPGDFVYRIDFRSNSRKDLAEYLDLFHSAGWEHVTTCANWQYFRIPADRYSTDIYSDSTSLIEKFKRMVNFAYLILFPNLLLFIMALPDLLPVVPSPRYTLTVIRILLHLIAVGLPLFWAINLNRKIAEIKKAI